MSYHEQPFNTRLANMGDHAEQVFEDVAPFGSFVRFGWNRPNLNMGKMSAFLRHAPDYYTSPGLLVEVMGCGRDHVVKLKLEKYEALKQWNTHNEVALFLWNSSAHEWAVLRWGQVKSSVAKVRQDVREFHDGNKYYPIPWDTVGGVPYGEG